MTIERLFLNSRAEALGAAYGSERSAQNDAVGRLFNRLLGPVTSLNVHRPEVVDLGLYSSSCSHSALGSLLPDLMVKSGIADNIIIPGGGKGPTMQQPILGGLGEIAERLLSVLHFGTVVDGLKLATHEELIAQGTPALGPEDIPLFASEQYASPDFGYVPFTPAVRLRWIEGIDILTGKPVLAPAQLINIYYKHHPAEAHIGYPTTGGLAFHTDSQRAILHGIYEYVERDAINIAWYCKLAPSRIDIDLASFLKSEGFAFGRMATPPLPKVEVFLNTLDIKWPVFTAVAIDQWREERALLGGGGASCSRNQALMQAIFELGQSRTALKFYRPIGWKNIGERSAVSEMTDFFDAVIYFGYRQNLARIEWYTTCGSFLPWEETPSREFKNTETEWAEMISVVRASGLHPIVFDFGSACWPGAHVIKVFIPELSQACVPSHPYLGHPRYRELPRKLGRVSRDLMFSDLNPDPVPFP